MTKRQKDMIVIIVLWVLAIAWAFWAISMTPAWNGDFRPRCLKCKALIVDGVHQ